MSFAPRSLVPLAFLSLFGCQTPPPAGTALLGHVPERALRAADLGPVPRDLPVRLVLGLRLHDAHRLPRVAEELHRSERGLGRPLAPEEFADRFAPSAGEYAALLAWLGARGLAMVRTAEGRTTITVEGRADDVENAFRLDLHHFRDGKGVFRAPTGDPTLEDGPPANTISGVVGFDDARGWKSDLRVVPYRPFGSGKGGTDAPSDLRALYGADQVMQQGEGETVAILGAGGVPDPVKDVSEFVVQTHLPSNIAAQYSQILLGGPTRDDQGAQGEYVENALDIDMVLSFAPKAKVVHVIVATNTPGLFTDGISYIVNKLPQAHAVTVSYGSCERVSAAEMPLLNALFAQAKAEGQQWFFASGDAGTDGCQDVGGKVMAVDWPAASPYVIGVGGTSHTGPMTEVVWGNIALGGAGGGGHSEAMDKPAYQVGVGPYPGDGARDVPDVSAMAGKPGVEMVANGGITGAEGTSASAPMWAGIWALIDQSRGGKGIANGHETLYALGKANLGFHDITSGSNTDNRTLPGFPALPGFDLATGWGTPNIPALLANWK